MRLWIRIGVGTILLTSIINIFTFLYVFQHSGLGTADESGTATIHKLQELEDNHYKLQQSHETTLNQLKEIQNINTELLSTYKKRDIDNNSTTITSDNKGNKSKSDNRHKQKHKVKLNKQKLNYNQQQLNNNQQQNYYYQQQQQQQYLHQQQQRYFQQSNNNNENHYFYENNEEEEEEDEEEYTSSTCIEEENRLTATWEAMEVMLGFRTAVGPDGEPTQAAKKLIKKTLEVPRVDGSTFTFEDFYLNYVKKEKPVVITNYMNRMLKTNWTLPYIAQHCAGQKARLMKYDPSNTRWGHLSAAEETTVDRFASKVAKGMAKDEYLFDFSIHLSCPTMMNDFTVPKYFATDYLQRIPSECWDDVQHSYKQYWPSLFIGTGATQSGLHVDAIQSHFWMGLLQGHKRWAIVPRNYVPLLYPDSHSRVFTIGSLFDVDVTRYPLLSKAVIYDTILNPGELMYVPGGAAHEVANLDTIVAISMNYIDEYNLRRATDLLREQQRVKDYLESRDFIHAVPKNQQDLPWHLYKTWPRPWEKYDLN